MFKKGGREQFVLLHVKKGGGEQVFGRNGKNSILSDFTSCILKN